MSKKGAKKPVKTQRTTSRNPVAGGKSAKGNAKESAVKSSACAARAAVLCKADIKKIQGLLKSKTPDGVTLGLSLLDSLGATRADYEAVFKEAVIKSILGGWAAESWGAVAKAVLPHKRTSQMFQRLAEEKFRRRPRKLFNFQGLQLAKMPTARAAFVANWGGYSRPKKHFIDLESIPAGSFTMGSPVDEADRNDDENQVKVRVTRPFQIGRTVVTQSQWRAVMGTEPWLADRNGEDFPAALVTWKDAEQFCQTLTDLEREVGRLSPQYFYRLPTEAEWEYTCRAGTTTAYCFGDCPAMIGRGGAVRLQSNGMPTGKLHLYAWYFSNSDGSMHPVAQKMPNPWGLFDMHGNVHEWCIDWYGQKLEGAMTLLVLRPAPIAWSVEGTHTVSHLDAARRSVHAVTLHVVRQGFVWSVGVKPVKSVNRERVEDLPLKGVSDGNGHYRVGLYVLSTQENPRGYGKGRDGED